MLLLRGRSGAGSRLRLALPGPARPGPALLQRRPGRLSRAALPLHAEPPAANPAPLAPSRCPASRRGRPCGTGGRSRPAPGARMAGFLPTHISRFQGAHCLEAPPGVWGSSPHFLYKQTAFPKRGVGPPGVFSGGSSCHGYGLKQHKPAGEGAVLRGPHCPVPEARVPCRLLRKALIRNMGRDKVLLPVSAPLLSVGFPLHEGPARRSLVAG